MPAGDSTPVTTGGAGGQSGGDAGSGPIGGSTAAGVAGAGGETTLPHPEGYSYRRRVFIEAETALPAGYAIELEIDHAAWVDAGRSRSDGDDVRLFYATADDYVEHHRVVDPASSWNRADTRIWFKLPGHLGGDKKLKQFYLYYDNPEAGSPPADPQAIYSFWDFDEPLDAEWSSSSIGDGVLTVEVATGSVTLAGQSGGLGSAADDFGLLSRLYTGDFVVDARIASVSGAPGPAATLGAVMLRSSLDVDAAYAAIGAASSDAVALGQRATAGGAGQLGLHPGLSPVPGFVRLVRLEDVATAYASSDGLAWTAVGDPVSFAPALGPAVLIGVAHATDGGAATATLDWLRVRPVVEQAPKVFLQSEQGPLN